MLLLVTYENQLTTYYLDQNIKTYILITTYLATVILSEQVSEVQCFRRDNMVSDKS